MRAFYLACLVSLITLSATLLALTNPGLALTNTGVRIALHRKASTTSGICTSYTPNADQLPCSEYSVTAPATGASLVYVVAALGDPGAGISLVSMGVDFDGRDETGPGAGDAHGIAPQYASWIACANGLPFVDDGPFGGWPKPQSGLSITWANDSCQNTVIGGTVHAVIGAFYLYAYSEDVFRITPNAAYSSQNPELRVSDCQGGDTDLLAVYPSELWATLTGRVHFGGDGSQGFSPCATTPVVPTSWGRMKARFTN